MVHYSCSIVIDDQYVCNRVIDSRVRQGIGANASEAG